MYSAAKKCAPPEAERKAKRTDNVLASRRGFEPPACRLGGGRSILLSYRDTTMILYHIGSKKARGLRKKIRIGFRQQYQTEFWHNISTFQLWQKSRVICPFEEVINGNAKIIGDCDQCLIIRLSFTAFIAAYCVLIHIKLNSESLLSHSF